MNIIAKTKPKIKRVVSSLAIAATATTLSIDIETSAKVMDVLTSACRKENITTIMVTHDESLAKYATRIIRLDSGKVKSDEKVT